MCKEFESTSESPAPPVCASSTSRAAPASLTSPEQAGPVLGAQLAAVSLVREDLAELEKRREIDEAEVIREARLQGAGSGATVPAAAIAGPSLHERPDEHNVTSTVSGPAPLPPSQAAAPPAPVEAEPDHDHAIRLAEEELLRFNHAIRLAEEELLQLQVQLEQKKTSAIQNVLANFQADVEKCWEEEGEAIRLHGQYDIAKPEDICDIERKMKKVELRQQKLMQERRRYQATNPLPIRQESDKKRKPEKDNNDREKKHYELTD